MTEKLDVGGIESGQGLNPDFEFRNRNNIVGTKRGWICYKKQIYARSWCEHWTSNAWKRLGNLGLKEI